MLLARLRELLICPRDQFIAPIAFLFSLIFPETSVRLSVAPFTNMV